MKPLELTMSAFGTFAKKTVINFEEISKNGVFLISGSNGSGKTTIFDGISFALYGETCNSKNRGKKTIHSDFVPIEEKSYVILKFSHQGKIYIIERSINFKKTDGILQASMNKPTIHDGNGELLAYRTKDVNQKIEDMLGMTQNEFAQTVMIAQGEFQKIVNADTTTRMQLFQKLFHTEIYSMFEKKLQERYKNCHENFESQSNHMIGYLEKIQLHPEFQPDAPRDAVSAEIYLAALQRQNLADKQIIANLESQKTACKKEQELLVTQITQGEIINQKLQELSQNYQKLQALQQQMSEIQNQETAVQKARNASQISGIEELGIQTRKKLISEKNRQENLLKNYDAQKIICQNTEQALHTANQNAQNLESLIQEEFALSQTLPKFQALHDAKAEYQHYTAVLKQIDAKFRSEHAEYLQLQEQFYLGQAGLLAEQLQSGKPCPVCGSPEHPAPAVRKNAVPSKSQLDKAKKSLDNTEKEFHCISEICKSCLTRLETFQKENPLLFTSDENSLIQKLNACRQNIQKLKHAQNSAQEDFTNAESGLKIIKTQLQESEKHITDITQELLQYRQDFKNALQKFHFSDIADYENAKLDSAMIRKLEQKIQNYHAEYHKLQGIVQKLEQETSEKSEISLELLKKQKQEKDMLYQKLETDYRNLHLTLYSNQEIMQKLPEQIQSYHQVYQKLQDLEELYRTVSGRKGAGQSKFKLEAYVQQYYFRRVVLQARQRLSVLTNHKFDLRCRETAKDNISQSGLGLEILDFATNQWRDVSTLSGGESFMLALSLALGLSDVIQESSGGIQIDAMFIDEGFGTLDETSLNQAVALLGRLADGKRLIGVISHVESLINRIDSKIYVTKKADGSEISFS